MGNKSSMVDQLIKLANGGARQSYLKNLSRPDRAILNDFVAYLVKEEGLKNSTASVYKSHLAKAFTSGSEVVEGTTKSALQAFARYRSNG